MKLTDLSDEDVIAGLRALVGQGNVLLARLLAYLAEVEERRLDLESACSSLFDFCVRRLAMSEDEASGKTKSQVQELVASRFPRPDLPSVVQMLPVTPTAPRQASVRAADSEPAPRAARVEPLAPERYGVQFTASGDLKQKIDRATDLMRHQNPSGDLSIVMDRALDVLIAELEKHRLGKTRRPRTNAPRKRTRPGYVTRAVRREVFERDGEQCTFVDEAGRRCESRAFLELDHRNPRALGASCTPARLRALAGFGAPIETVLREALAVLT